MQARSQIRYATATVRFFFYARYWVPSAAWHLPVFFSTWRYMHTDQIFFFLTHRRLEGISKH